MFKNQEEAIRTQSFKRNLSLEKLLEEVNAELWSAESLILDNTPPKHPLIFILGPHRSGTTLLLQWLASLGSVAYPTNLMSRFYNAPILAAKIQLLLTDERYNYRNELRDFNSTLDFSSENGKTIGALSPKEFWYFWRRFLPYQELDYIESNELFKNVDTKLLQSELSGLVSVFDKPFALKAMILNYNIDFIDTLFENALFIYTKRDPLANIESALKAREKQLGSINEWYSFKIPEYEQLKDLAPYDQVGGQIYYINKAISEGLSRVDENKKMVIEYEEFCNEPQAFYSELTIKLEKLGHKMTQQYNGMSNFEQTRKNINNQKIIHAYSKFSKRFGN